MSSGFTAVDNAGSPSLPGTMTEVYRRAMRFQVLGPLEVLAGDDPIALGGPKQRAVLAHLLLRPNQIVPAVTLIDEIWGDEPPDSARNTLQTYVSHLRKALGDGRIDGRPPGYRLEVGRNELDADRFDDLLRDARKAATTDPTAAVPVLEDALSLWRGPAFADLADEPSLAGEAARLNELRLTAQEARLEALLASGEHARVVGEAESLLARHPLREGIWGALMLALYRSGRQADALGAFQRARDLLGEELGIDPSPELVTLHEQLLRQDPDLDLRGEPLRGYRLLERIGDGPRATVYRAIQPKVGRDVAVKIVGSSLASEPGFIRRFETDAQAAAGLEHPHIVPIYDYWREPEGAYIVSRYLRGGSLGTLTDREPEIDQRRAIRISRQIASALASAHRQGVVHGHVGASNVLLDTDGNAYLADFRIGTPQPVEPSDDVAALARLSRAVLRDAVPAALIPLLERIDADDTLVTAEDVERALAETPSYETPEVRPADVRNPYKGLRAFGHSDARDFFGREALTDHLVAELGETGDTSRFLAVVGPSGSGKSSVVRAGLLPALGAGALPGSADWFVAEMVPGPHPIEELEAALLRIGARPTSRLLERLESGSRGLLQAVDLVVPGATEILLVVDQFEEVFTLTEHETERDAFLELLRVAVADPGSRVRVVITLRADFFDRPLQHPRFSELLAKRTVAVPPMSPDELERAISGPAREVGVSIEPGLVVEIVADVADQPGTLPLVEFALTELFERRDERATMTADGFSEIGGVTGALTSRAEQLYRMMEPNGRTATRQVLLRLVTLGEGREDTRRRVSRAELTTLEIRGEELDAVLDAFGRHRLLTFDREPSTREPTVEIAHEAFLREWPRLRGWINEARDDVRQARLLTRSAIEWRAADADPSFLLVGSRLDQVESWSRSTGLALGNVDREFLAASLAQRERTQEEAAQREAHEQKLEHRSRSRLRALVAVLAAAAMVASTLTIVAVRQRGAAVEQSRLAFARELSAAADANLDVDPERSILLALQAIEATEADGLVLRQSIEALHAGIQRDRLLFTIDDPSTGNVAWSPRGDVLATGGSIGGNTEFDAVLWDADTGREIRRLKGHTGDLSSVSFSNDGSLLVSSADASNPDSAIVWDTTTGEEVHSFAAQEGTFIPSGTFSPDGRLLALGVLCCIADTSEPPLLRVIETSDWKVVRGLETEGSPVFSPDGRRLLVSDAVWDVETWRRVVELPGVDGVWRPDGRVLAQYSYEGNEIILVDARSGRELDKLPMPNGVTGLAWSPDGTSLATGAGDGTVRVWDTTTGAELMSLHGHSGVVGMLSFSPDGRKLLTGGADATARVWDVSREGGREVLAAAQPFPLTDVSFAPDGGMTTSTYSGAWTWDMNELRRAAPYPGAYAATYSPDGTKLGILSGDDRATVIELSTGEAVDIPGRAGALALSPDGSTVALGRQGNQIRLFDTASRSFLGPSLGEPLPLEGSEEVAFSPDGAMVASIGGRANVRIWDAEGPDLITEVQGNSGQGRALAWDPRGGVLATAGADGVSIWEAPSFEHVATVPSGGGVLDLAYSADGSRLATVSEDGATRVFDTGSWGEVLGLTGDDYLVSVALSPDGKLLATAGDSGIIRVYALETPALVELALSRLSRTLTEEECRQYLHTDTCPALDQPPLPSAGPAATAVDGAYQRFVTAGDLRAAGVAHPRDHGSFTLRLLDGASWLTWIPGGETWSHTVEGSYVVVGDRLTITDVSDAGCAGTSVDAEWSLETGSLMLSDLEVIDSPDCPNDGWTDAVFTSGPWTRLGQLSRPG
jgi:WD40 repeat protein/DNA-binding SARP family transcriptional activator